METTTSVVIAAILIAGAVGWALDGVESTDPYRDVSTIVDDPSAFAANPSSIKGLVVAGTIADEGGLITFLLEDQSGNEAFNGTNMSVRYAGVLPDAFGPKLVVVTGRVIPATDGFVFDADEIQVGCSSKY